MSQIQSGPLKRESQSLLSGSVLPYTVCAGEVEKAVSGGGYSSLGGEKFCRPLQAAGSSTLEGAFCLSGLAFPDPLLFC